MHDSLTAKAEELLASMPLEIWTESEDGQICFQLARDGLCKHTKLNATLGRFERVRHMVLGDDQAAFLRWLATGEKSCDELKTCKMSGQRRAWLVRYGYAEWIRPPDRPLGNAIGIRITENGQKRLLADKR